MKLKEFTDRLQIEPPINLIMSYKKYYEVKEVALIRKKNSSKLSLIATMGIHKRDNSYYLMTAKEKEICRTELKNLINENKIKYEKIDSIKEYRPYVALNK